MRILLTLTALIIQFSVYAQSSDRVVTENGKKYIIHTVKPKETLYRISKTYGAGISEVIRLNPQITGNDIKIGEELKIPFKEAYVVNDGTLVDKKQSEAPKRTTSIPVSSTPEPKQVSQKEVAQQETIQESKPAEIPVKEELSEELPEGLDPNASQHIVQAGETLFRISKWYGKEVSDLVKLNKLKDYNISKGQVIVLRSEETNSMADNTTEAKPEVTETKPETKPEVKPDNSAKAKENPPVEKAKDIPDVTKNEGIAEESIRMTRYTTKYMQLAEDAGYEQKEFEQVISFINDNRSPNKTGWFAIHKSLPVGTYVKIVNPINGATAYAKIIQNLPESPENKGIDIKLPLAAAQSDLKIFDDVTRVKVYPLLKKAK